MASSPDCVAVRQAETVIRTLDRSADIAYFAEAPQSLTSQAYLRDPDADEFVPTRPDEWIACWSGKQGEWQDGEGHTIRQSEYFVGLIERDVQGNIVGYEIIGPAPSLYAATEYVELCCDCICETVPYAYGSYVFSRRTEPYRLAPLL